MKSRFPLSAAAVAVALLVGSACSSGGDEPATTTTAPVDATSEAGDGTDGDGTDTTSDDETTTTTSGDASGNGSGDGTPDEQAYVDAMEESLRPSSGSPMSEDQARCLAPRLIEILDPERLADAGVEPDELHTAGGLDVPGIDLEEDEANAMYDSYGECDIDMRAVFLDGVLAGSGLDAEEIACVESVVTDDKIRALMVGMTMVGEEAVDDLPEVAAFGAELEACTE